MSQYPVGRQESAYDVERSGPLTANADRLGLSVLGFVTVLLGCYYVGFSAPTIVLSRFAFGAILTASGIVEILAGMWAFRKNTETTAIFPLDGQSSLAENWPPTDEVVSRRCPPRLFYIAMKSAPAGASSIRPR